MLTGREVRVVAGMLGISLVCGAFGQIAPPPGPAAPATPEWVPPPRSNTEAPPVPKQDNTPVPSWRDNDGKLEVLSEPLYWASLKKNQLVTPKVAEGLKGFLRQRERQYERVVVDNIDLMRKVMEGAIDKTIEMPRDPAAGRAGADVLSKLLQIIKPLVGDSIREAVKTKGLLSRMQSDHQNKIVRAYTDDRGRDLEAATPVLPADASEEQKKARTAAMTKEKMRHQLYDFIDESTWVYAWLLNDVAMHWDDTLAKTDFDAATKAKLNAAFKDVKAATDDRGRVAAMKKLVVLVTPEQERVLLQGMIAGRPTQPEPAAEPEKPADDAAKTDAGAK